MADLSTVTSVKPLTFLVMPGASLPAGLRTSKFTSPATVAAMLKSLLPRPASLPATVRVLVWLLKTTVGSPTGWTCDRAVRSSSTASRGRWPAGRLAAGLVLRGRTAFRQDLSRRATMASASRGVGLLVYRQPTPPRRPDRRGRSRMAQRG